MIKYSKKFVACLLALLLSPASLNASEQKHSYDNYNADNFFSTCDGEIAEFREENGSWKLQKFIISGIRNKYDGAEYVCINPSKRELGIMLYDGSYRMQSDPNSVLCKPDRSMETINGCNSKLTKTSKTQAAVSTAVLPLTLLLAATRGGATFGLVPDVDAIKKIAAENNLYEAAVAFSENKKVVSKSTSGDIEAIAIKPIVVDKTGAVSALKNDVVTKCDVKKIVSYSNGVANDENAVFTFFPRACAVKPSTEVPIRFFSSIGPDAKLSQNEKPGNLFQVIPRGTVAYEPVLTITEFKLLAHKLQFNSDPGGNGFHGVATIGWDNKYSIAFNNDSSVFITVSMMSLHFGDKVFMLPSKVVIPPKSTATSKGDLPTGFIGNPTSLSKSFTSVGELDQTRIYSGVSIEYVANGATKTFSTNANNSLRSLTF